MGVLQVYGGVAVSGSVIMPWLTAPSPEFGVPLRYPESFKGTEAEIVQSNKFLS